MHPARYQRSELEQEYIGKIEQLLHNEADPVSVAKAISNMYIPGYTYEFVRCIQDSLPDVAWESEDTDDSGRAEVDASLQSLAGHSLKIIKNIIHDFEQGVMYHTEYRVTALYSRLEKNKLVHTRRREAITAKDYEEAAQRIATYTSTIPQQLTTNDTKTWSLERVEAEARIVRSDGRVMRDWMWIN